MRQGGKEGSVTCQTRGEGTNENKEDRPGEIEWIVGTKARCEEATE